jgi:PAS domain-containing protein
VLGISVSAYQLVSPESTHGQHLESSEAKRAEAERGEPPASDPQAGDPLSARERKAAAERLLFVGFVVSLALLAGAGAVFTRSIYLSRRLDKLSEMTRMGGHSPAPALSRMGELGRRIRRLYEELLEISDRKSDKISALTAANETVLRVTARPVAILDARAVVLRANRAMLELLQRQPSEVVGSSAEELFEDAGVSAALERLTTVREEISLAWREAHISLIPVYGRGGTLSYGVCVVERHEPGNSTGKRA